MEATLRILTIIFLSVWLSAAHGFVPTSEASHNLSSGENQSKEMRIPKAPPINDDGPGQFVPID